MSLSEERQSLVEYNIAEQQQQQQQQHQQQQLGGLNSEQHSGLHKNDQQESEEVSPAAAADDTPTAAPAAAVVDDDDTAEKTVTSSYCVTCMTSCLGSRPVEQRRLLALNLILLVWCLSTAGISLVEIYYQSYGQCMIGMALYEGGLDPRNVNMYYCKCPLYTLLLTGCVSWLSLMVNWVSDLHSKRPVFYKWLRYQALLTAAAAVAVAGSLFLKLYGFIKWCEQVHQRVLEDTQPPVPAGYQCFDNARVFDDYQKREEQNQLVQLHDTFIYTLSITMLLVVHTFLWMIALYYTIRILKIEPKDNFDPTAYQALAVARPIYPSPQTNETVHQTPELPRETLTSGTEIESLSGGSEASKSPQNTDEGFRSEFNSLEQKI